MNNWVEISTGRLAANLRVAAAAAGPGTEILAVVKANAYGHGAELCAATLVAAGARWLGVTCAAEGARVRAAAGPAAEILVMCGFLPEDVATLREHRLLPVVWTAEQIAWLSGSSSPAAGMRVHVEIDTGMGRQGVQPGEPLARLLDQLHEAALVLDGVFTHFCSAEEAHSPLTQAQERLFETAVAQVAETCRASSAPQPRWVHAGNSSTIDNPAQPWPWLESLAATLGARAMVRTGLALYGHCLPIAGDAQPRLRPALQPVLTWKARVLAVRTLAPGESVGYNATFIADRPTRVALLVVGYADGLRRELSGGRGWVMLGGTPDGSTRAPVPAPILGRISMNLTVVDATGIDDVAAGDEAVVLGEGITAEDHARLAGTIAYEILCGIHPCG